MPITLGSTLTDKIAANLPSEPIPRISSIIAAFVPQLWQDYIVQLVIVYPYPNSVNIRTFCLIHGKDILRDIDHTYNSQVTQKERS